MKKILTLCLVCMLVVTGCTSKQEATPAEATPAEAVEPFTSLSYYKEENQERYEAYQQEHPKYSEEKVVTRVNAYLDYGFYKHDVKVKDPDAVSVIVNKYYTLDDDYAPSDLVIVNDSKSQPVVSNCKSAKVRKVCAKAFKKLRKACNEEGFNIYAHSGYRSTEYQRQIYKAMCDAYGKKYANSKSSKPGHSEHTTGLAMDVQINNTEYSNLKDSKYYDQFYDLLPEYGFIIRYPKGKTKITGYAYESWHIRYVGVKVAKYIREHDMTYEEYYAQNY